MAVTQWLLHALLKHNQHEKNKKQNKTKLDKKYPCDQHCFETPATLS